MQGLQRIVRLLQTRNIAGAFHLVRQKLGLRRRLLPPDRKFLTALRPSSSRFEPIPKKFLFFSHNLLPEGAPISLCQLVIALKNLYQAECRVVSFADGPLRQNYEAAGIPVTVCPLYPEEMSTPARLAARQDAMAEIIDHVRPDWVFANTLCCFLPILAAASLQTPSLLIVRESAAWERFFSYLPETAAPYALRSIMAAEHVVFVSQASLEVWQEWDWWGRFSLIHNGIDTRPFAAYNQEENRLAARRSLAVSENEVHFLSVGTLCPRKNQLELLSALSCLPKESIPKIRVTLVGNGDRSYTRKVLAAKRKLPHDLRERVSILPAVADIGRFYASADVFVFCSLEESYPRVILEAMSFGLAIITTPVHGVAEQVKEGRNAWYYPAGDHQVLGQKIALLAQDDAMRKSLGRESAELFKQLPTLEGMAAQYYGLCQKERK